MTSEDSDITSFDDNERLLSDAALKARFHLLDRHNALLHDENGVFSSAIARQSVSCAVSVSIIP